MATYLASCSAEKRDRILRLGRCSDRESKWTATPSGEEEQQPHSPSPPQPTRIRRPARRPECRTSPPLRRERGYCSELREPRKDGQACRPTEMQDPDEQQQSPGRRGPSGDTRPSSQARGRSDSRQDGSARRTAEILDPDEQDRSSFGGSLPPSQARGPTVGSGGRRTGASSLMFLDKLEAAECITEYSYAFSFGGKQTTTN